MSIRSAAKAIIIDGGKILLNKCHGDREGVYYTLPGGGQNQYEPLSDAVVRECLEETGYTVKPVKIAALCEEIFLDPEIREEYPDYAHKLHHIFLCELEREDRAEPTEKDSTQLDSEWIPIDSLGEIKILPKLVEKNISAIISGTAPVFLGTELIAYNHG